jgi:hypothetical protein
MRKQYDFSASRKNPYAAQLKKSVTIRLDQDSITYFKSVAEQTGITTPDQLVADFQKDIARWNRENSDS